MLRCLVLARTAARSRTRRKPRLEAATRSPLSRSRTRCIPIPVTARLQLIERGVRSSRNSIPGDRTCASLDGWTRYRERRSALSDFQRTPRKQLYTLYSANATRASRDPRPATPTDPFLKPPTVPSVSWAKICTRLTEKAKHSGNSEQEACALDGKVTLRSIKFQGSAHRRPSHLQRLRSRSPLAPQPLPRPPRPIRQLRPMIRPTRPVRRGA